LVGESQRPISSHLGLVGDSRQTVGLVTGVELGGWNGIVDSGCDVDVTIPIMGVDATTGLPHPAMSNVASAM
jgi:hypothetical protein